MRLHLSITDNGVGVARALKHRPQLKVIILSMYADESYVVRALSAGARAYVLKEATEEDLLPAVRTVAAGRSFFSPAVTRLLLEDYVRPLQQRGLEDSCHLLMQKLSLRNTAEIVLYAVRKGVIA
jgi:two-component system, NarL family, response regulator NreC